MKEGKTTPNPRKTQCKVWGGSHIRVGLIRSGPAKKFRSQTANSCEAKEKTAKPRKRA